MFEFIRENQLNIMLLLCGSCGILALLLLITRFLSKRRKWILILMELTAMFLLWFDRLAYIYAGDISHKAYYMVRFSNLMVFILTPTIVIGFNLFICDYLSAEGKLSPLPRRLIIVNIMSVIAILMAIISAFTGLYYTFDHNNLYQRGDWFFISYIIPLIGPIIQYTVIRKYKKHFSRLIYVSMVIYIFVPITFALIQFFAYGISIVNMAMVLVSISLYIFTYLDINNTVEHAHQIEIQDMQGEKRRMERLFDQTAKAFVSAVEQKDDFTKGHAVRVAEYSQKLAKLAGKSEEDCKKAYYAGLLHDVGLIGIPDSVIKNGADPTQLDFEAIRQKPVLGKEILSNITEYPYLSLGAGYSHERYNGTGYPEGRKGADIPEIARVVAVADAYVTMTSKKRYRDARPDFVAREAFVKGAGAEFDPLYAGLMVGIIDEETSRKSHDDISLVEKELICGEYRDKVSLGIPVGSAITNISFDSSEDIVTEGQFTAPSIIIFDSFDRRIHKDAKAIEAYKYQEFCEVWFDGHVVNTAARKVSVSVIDGSSDGNLVKEVQEKGIHDTSAAVYKKIASRHDTSAISYEKNAARYEISAARYEDHIKLNMKSPGGTREIVIAFRDGATALYIGITGEHCKISDIAIEQTDQIVDASYIPRIADEVSYIDHYESDIKNIQINQTCSAYTEGIELDREMKLIFHSVSLPVASFIWHCPYVVIYSSGDGRIKGEDYHEYALIKLNGEIECTSDYSDNNFIMKKKDTFPGWDTWKEKNRQGVESTVSFQKKGNRIITKTENMGIYIECTTNIKDNPSKVYVALTGDRCALTDIRIR